MDPTVTNMFNGDLAQAVARRRDISDHAASRLRDASDYDMRLMGFYSMQQLFQSNTPMYDSSLNAAMRTPSDMGPQGAYVPTAAVAQK